MTLLAAILAFVVGVTLGLLGGGGSILTVPAIVFALGIEPKLAIVMSFPIVGGAAFVGALQHWRLGHIDVRVALLFGLSTMLGAFAGGWAARGIPGGVQFVVLAIVMLGAAGSLFRSAQYPEREVAEPRGITPGLLLIGVATGLLTGIVGVGGGFLLVPALVLFADVPMKKAIGTSLLVIAMNTAAGYAGAHGSLDVPWRIVFAFGSVAAVGIVVGTLLVPRVPVAALKQGFAGLLVAMSGYIFYLFFTTL